uniref:Uncharacterized protein n=1 Tax=Anguilla anguilla TaxID=7936 RepID=A0A0E9UMP1_ANGAN
MTVFGLKTFCYDIQKELAKLKTQFSSAFDWSSTIPISSLCQFVVA